jgi:hypothetical protein
MLLLLLPASVASGLLAGLMGAGGPPLMAAYALLEVEKDALLGFGVVPSAYMVLRLGMYMNADGSVHDDGEWGLYAGIVGAGLAGMAAGNGARRFVASGTVLTMVVGLVFVSSALMLDAATTPPLLALYVALTAGAAAAWVGLRGRPALFSKLCCAPQRQL